MAWTTPTTVNPGDAILASLWNTQVKDNLLELAPFSAAWTSFTPTLTNVTAGNGTHSSAYLKVGRLVIVRYEFTLGSTSSISGAPVFSLPSGITVSGALLATQVEFLDAGTTRYVGMVEVENNTNVVCQALSASGSYVGQVAPTSTIPFTWTTGDRIYAGIVFMSTS